jgi:hypothetical protein
MAYGGIETPTFRFDAPVRSRSTPYELISAKKTAGYWSPPAKILD